MNEHWPNVYGKHMNHIMITMYTYTMHESTLSTTMTNSSNMYP